MRTVLVSLAAVLCLGLVNSAQAERRMFIIVNDADGYGIDRCLAAGAECGTGAANAYCKSHQYAEAASFRKVDREDITGAILSGSVNDCKGPKCNNFVVIVCAR